MCRPSLVDGYVGSFAKGVASVRVGVIRGEISQLMYKVFLATSSDEACVIDESSRFLRMKGVSSEVSPDLSRRRFVQKRSRFCLHRSLFFFDHHNAGVNILVLGTKRAARRSPFRQDGCPCYSLWRSRRMVWNLFLAVFSEKDLRILGRHAGESPSLRCATTSFWAATALEETPRSDFPCRLLGLLGALASEPCFGCYYHQRLFLLELCGTPPKFTTRLQSIPTSEPLLLHLPPCLWE